MEKTVSESSMNSSTVTSSNQKVCLSSASRASSSNSTLPHKSLTQCCEDTSAPTRQTQNSSTFNESTLSYPYSASNTNISPTLSPILSTSRFESRYPFFPNRSGSYPDSRYESLYVSKFPRIPSRNLGTPILKRSMSERVPGFRPQSGDSGDSGVCFTTPNDLHNAKASAKAMARAINEDQRIKQAASSKRSAEENIASKIKLDESAKGSGITSKPVPHMGLGCPKGRPIQHYRPTDAQRRVFVKNRPEHNLSSLPPTALSQTSSQLQSPIQFTPNSKLPLRFTSLRRPPTRPSDSALEYRALEQNEERTRREILEGHLHRIENAIVPSLKEGPRRSIDLVLRTGRVIDVGEAGRMGDVGAEMAMEELSLQPRKGLWKRVKGWCRRKSGRGG